MRPGTYLARDVWELAGKIKRPSTQLYRSV